MIAGHYVRSTEALETVEDIRLEKNEHTEEHDAVYEEEDQGSAYPWEGPSQVVVLRVQAEIAAVV